MTRHYARQHATIMNIFQKLLNYCLMTMIFFIIANRFCNGCVPWKPMENLLKTPESRTMVVIFTNQSSGMPTKFLEGLQNDYRPVSIFDCAQSGSGQIEPFLKETRIRCRQHCSYLVLCNEEITTKIMSMSLDFDLVKPWTLWAFADPTALKLMEGANFKRTGVSVAIPVWENTSMVDANINFIKNTDCLEYNGVRVFSRQKNRLTEMEAFLVADNDTVLRKVSVSSVTPEKFLNLYNETILVGVKELPPFLEKDMKTKRYKGACIKLLEVFAKALNFSYKIVPSNVIGVRIQNGSEAVWTGLLGQISRREIDLALGALSVTEERSSIAEFTEHFAEDTSSILSTKPGQQSRILIFIRVFPWQVWLLLFVSIIVVGPSMTVLDRGFTKNETSMGLIINKKTSVWRYWWDLLTSTMQRGEVTPSRNTARILAVFWLMFTVVLVGLYTGLLLAVMSFPGTEEPIDSVGKLTQTRNVHPTAFKQSTTFNYFQTSSSKINNKIRQRWTDYPEQKFPANVDEAISLMSTGTYALLSERLIFHYLIAKQLHTCDCCPFYVAKEDFLKHYYSFAVPKNSAIVGSLNIIISRLRQMGIISQWLSDSLPNIEACHDAKSDINVLRPMDLEDIQGAFYTLAIGLTVAIVIFIGEIYVNCRRKRHERELDSLREHLRWLNGTWKRSARFNNI